MSASGNLWGHNPASGYTSGVSLVGYKVEATDGHIGKVDKHNDEVASAYLVIDTGVWIFGKHVLLPAGTVTRIDADNRTVYVDRSKDQIKSAPEFDRDKHMDDPTHRDEVGNYYDRTPGTPAPGTQPGQAGRLPGEQGPGASGRL